MRKHCAAQLTAIFVVLIFVFGMGALTESVCAQEQPSGSSPDKTTPGKSSKDEPLPSELALTGKICVTVAERDELQKIMKDYRESRTKLVTAENVLKKFADKGYYSSSDELNQNEAAKTQVATLKPKVAQLSAQFTKLVSEYATRTCPLPGGVTMGPPPGLPPYHKDKSKEIPNLPCMTAEEKKTLQEILDKLVPVEEKMEALQAQEDKSFSETKTIPIEMQQEMGKLRSEFNTLTPQYNKLIEAIFKRECPPPTETPPVVKLPAHDAKTCPTCRSLASQIADLDDQIASSQRQDQSLRKNADLSNAGIQNALKEISDKIASLKGKKAGLETERSECEKKCVTTEEKKTGSPTGGKTKNRKAEEKKRGKKADDTAVGTPSGFSFGVGSGGGRREERGNDIIRGDDRGRQGGGGIGSGGGISPGR